MKIYTKTGDDGTTGLFNGQRVSKTSLRVEAYGTVDELNSILGIISTYELDDVLKYQIDSIINLLFNVGTDLATPISEHNKFPIYRINNDDVLQIELFIDELTDKLPGLKNFILPGGTRQAAFFHQARTVCRRAERMIVRLSESEQIGLSLVLLLNRLSDYFFTAARYANFSQGIDDITWKAKK